MTSRRIHFVSLLILVSLLAGCADWLPNRRAAPAVPHDLGWLPPPPVVSLEETPVVAVEAPPWLNEPALRYRRVGNDSTALLRYPDDYWIAPPRELLFDRVQQSLLASRHVAPRPNSPRYRLEVRLLRFEQEQAGTRSESVVSLQALLLDPRNRRQFASPAITARVADASPGAAGAVRGLGQATDQAIAELMTWLANVQAQNPAPEAAVETAPPAAVGEGLRSLFSGPRPQR
jgi:cholesterol transport system auxiliary component